MPKDTVVIVDPFSTGALIAPELKKRGIKCYGVLSSETIPQRFTQSYTGEGFVDKTLYSAGEIAGVIDSNNLLAIIPGSETGVYCAEKLASPYNVTKNDYRTTDYRRKKSIMQQQLALAGLKHIASKKISQTNTDISDINSDSGYVIKPDSSCLTDGVVFFDNKEEATNWISQINWEQTNITGVPNEYYLVQEKLDGEEFVVDLVVDGQDIKVCTLCRYKKGLHNGSHFVYQSLEVLDVNDPNYTPLIEYAKKSVMVLGVEFGPAHLEIMNTKNGPILIELGARLHGGIAPLVFEKCYSPGLLTSVIDMLTQSFDTTPVRLTSKARIVFLINEKEHFTISDTAALTEQMLSVKCVEHVKFFINDNQPVPLTIDLSNCPGIVSLVATSDTELDISEQQIRNLFQ
ncbi:ATP-grasp domain-containing protein [Pantoea sp. FN0302]|uniref:ATP-grasp domain-containing protein n=1 Tax=Pantoea sp. FN0302 TaxID=3418558 RepID=UPI003CFACC3A